MLTGVIVKGIGGFYYVKAENNIYECKARGKFRKDSIIPMVGDKVDISIKDGKGNIELIHERTSMLIRPAVANVNQLVVVVAVAAPQPNLSLIDNFMVMGELNGLDTILCLNKTDLSDGEEIRKIYESAGYTVVCTSTKNCTGFDELKEILKDKITVFAGNSGVGKSSILNAIDLEFVLETGEVSDKIKRGKHTTRHVELLELSSGGLVLDTPGFSTFELPDIKADELENYFPEFTKYLGKCRFRGCAHISEPDCAVLTALKNGEISPMRYNSYTDMYSELKKIKEWEK